MDQLDQPIADEHFDLVVRDGRPAFRLILKDHGVVVGPDALHVMHEGRMVRVGFADIRSVSLSLASTGRSGVAGICAIGLASGDKIIVSTVRPSGLPDPSKEGIYRRFVEALHARLLASGAAAHIGFSQGFSSGRRAVLLVALVLGAVLFVGGPLLGFALSHELKPLLLLAVGIGLLVPFWRVYNVNAPRNYLPTNPPDLLP